MSDLSPLCAKSGRPLAAPDLWVHALVRRVLAPFARRGAELLLEDTAEVGEVVEAPCERDIANVPSRQGGV